jgi:hypothetical protein
MPTGRLAVAHGMILTLLAGGLYDTATGREHWPFSPYAMFAEVDLSRSASKLVLVGMDEDRNLEVPRAGAWVAQPLSVGRLGVALELELAEPRGAERVALIVTQLLARYDRMRVQGRHPGPRLAALRLYRLEWNLDIAVDRARPADRRTLIVEARQP